MAASSFRSLSEENIAQLLNDKYSENTKKSTKQHCLIFDCSGVSGSFTNVLRRGDKKKMDRCIQKNSLCSIKFSLCRNLKQYFLVSNNQLLFTKFVKNLRHIELMTSKVQPSANY